MSPDPEVTDLDRALGDPWRADNPFGFAAAVAADARAEPNSALVDRLRERDFHLCYVPEPLGGRLRGLDRTHLLVRAAARRDLAVMPATMFSIAALTAAAAVSDGAAEAVARHVTAGGTVAFALSEEHAGSDVLAGTCRLEPADDGGYRLYGRKWLVGRGATADAVYLVARTGERGPGAFTAVLLDGAQLDHPATVRHRPAPTTGMRGVDFADLEFRGTPVPATAVTGGVGRGLEAAMRAQQVVRLMSTAASAAAADTGLRVALRFAAERHVGGTPVARTASGAAQLALAATELLVVDAMTLAACRGVHVAPARFALWSHTVKRVAPLLADDALRRCAGLLGARAVLAEGPGAVLDKARRDAAVVPVIDTSVVGNLRAAAIHVPRYRDPAPPPDAARRDRLAATFGLAAALPPLRPEALDLGVRPVDDVTHGLLELLPEMLAADGDPLAGKLVAELAGRLTELAGLAADAQRDRSAALTALADRWCLLHAAAACALLWWHNREVPLYGRPPGDPGWLTACLAYLLCRAAGRDPAGEGERLAPALTAVRALVDDGRLVTAAAVRLAESQGSSSTTGGDG
jgi:alkylation response protein AidB-like acyl-CoA dehydrogenase